MRVREKKAREALAACGLKEAKTCSLKVLQATLSALAANTGKLTMPKEGEHLAFIKEVLDALQAGDTITVRRETGEEEKRKKPPKKCRPRTEGSITDFVLGCLQKTTKEAPVAPEVIYKALEGAFPEKDPAVLKRTGQVLLAGGLKRRRGVVVKRVGRACYIEAPVTAEQGGG